MAELMLLRTRNTSLGRAGLIARAALAIVVWGKKPARGTAHRQLPGLLR